MKILYVEDYKLLRESVALGIRDKGWLVDTSSDGEEGLWMATENEYDAIILDVMLPKLNGFEILKQLRKNSNNTPVIMLTAKDELENRIEGLDSGADDYLTKPFYIDELISRINALYRRTSNQRQPVITCGDIEINTITKTVTRSGKIIDLTTREYALIEYFAHRMNEVVTRTDIWEHVYGSEHNSTSNIVDVYIGYLRKKLNVNGAPNRLHTKRGHGYYLTYE
ncbi:MAG: response regulator transcription factor [Akkermansiaceae bacterium]